jgi:hypothetical protein
MENLSTLYKKAQKAFPTLSPGHAVQVFLQPFKQSEFMALDPESQKMILNTPAGNPRKYQT